MNQNPEQLARDRIDKQLTACGWLIQHKKAINLHAGPGVAVREYQTDIGPADYLLFVDKKPVGVIEAKRVEEGVLLTIHEDHLRLYKVLSRRLRTAEETLQIARAGKGIR